MPCSVSRAFGHQWHRRSAEGVRTLHVAHAWHLFLHPRSCTKLSAPHWPRMSRATPTTTPTPSQASRTAKPCLQHWKPQCCRTLHISATSVALLPPRAASNLHSPTSATCTAPPLQPAQPHLCNLRSPTSATRLPHAATRSNSAICVPGSASASELCWPFMSTSRPLSARSARSVTGQPLIKQRERRRGGVLPSPGVATRICDHVCACVRACVCACVCVGGLSDRHVADLVLMPISHV